MICKIFEITRTIYSNSERSEQFLVIECFFNLFLEVTSIIESNLFLFTKIVFKLLLLERKKTAAI